MRPYCEIVVSELLPAIRAEITQELIEKYGFKQVEVSEELGITQAAVSQYHRRRRGTRSNLLTEDKKVKDLIKDICSQVVSHKIDSKEMHERFCEICETVRSRRLICNNHERVYPTIAPCNLCSEQG